MLPKLRRKIVSFTTKTRDVPRHSCPWFRAHAPRAIHEICRTSNLVRDDAAESNFRPDIRTLARSVPPIGAAGLATAALPVACSTARWNSQQADDIAFFLPGCRSCGLPIRQCACFLSAVGADQGVDCVGTVTLKQPPEPKTTATSQRHPPCVPWPQTRRKPPPFPDHSEPTPCIPTDMRRW